MVGVAVGLAPLETQYLLSAFHAPISPVGDPHLEAQYEGYGEALEMHEHLCFMQLRSASFLLAAWSFGLTGPTVLRYGEPSSSMSRFMPVMNTIRWIFGTLLVKPRSPSYPWIMLLLTVPSTLILAAVGLARLSSAFAPMSNWA